MTDLFDTMRGHSIVSGSKIIWYTTTTADILYILIGRVTGRPLFVTDVTSSSSSSSTKTIVNNTDILDQHLAPDDYYARICLVRTTSSNYGFLGSIVVVVVRHGRIVFVLVTRIRHPAQSSPPRRYYRA